VSWIFGATPATNTPATGAVAIWQLISTLKLAGAVVKSDSDGTTYSATGGQVTSGASGAHGLGNAGAWVRWKMPNGREFEIQRGTDNTQWWGQYSASAGFTGGSPAAHVMPTATDQIVLNANTGPAYTDTNTLFAASDGSYYFACGASTIAPYAFYFVAWSGTSCVGAWLVDGIVSPGASNDPDPFISYLDGITGPPMWGGGGPTTTGSVCAFNIDGTGAANQGAQAPLAYSPSNGYATDYGNGLDQLIPIVWGTTTSPYSPGIKGYSATFLWCVTGNATYGTRATPANESYGGQSYLLIESIVVPWDGSTPSGSSGSYTAELVFPLFVPHAPPPVAVVTPPQAFGGALNLTLQIGTSQNPNPYGVDINCLNDLDPYFSLVGGIQVLAQDLYHRITTSPGTVPGAPDFGFNSIGLLSQGVTQASLAAIQSNMTSQLQADERVQTANVSLSYQNGALTVIATVLPLNPLYAAQPFQFVASISTIGASLLSISPVLS
jgi:hypothetical protein